MEIRRPEHPLVYMKSVKPRGRKHGRKQARSRGCAAADGQRSAAPTPSSALRPGSDRGRRRHHYRHYPF